MSNRKDNIKKSLGITEYPWSSDDDENEASSNMPDVHLLRNVFDGNVNLPGTSAGSSQADNNPTPATLSQVKKSQVKLERDTYWSLIDGHGQGSMPQTSGVNRPDVTQLPFSRTMSHVPAEEFGSSSNRGSTVAEIKRMIAIKKLTRTLHGYRPSKSGHSINTARGASGSSKSTPVFNPSLDLVSGQNSQMKTKKQNTGQSGASTSFKRSSGGSGAGSSRSPQPGSSGTSRLQVSEAPATLHVYHSDSDVEMASLDNSTPKQENDANEAPEGGVQNSLAGQVSLEEIVEIDAEPEASVTAVNGDTDANEHAGNDSTDNAGNPAESNEEAQQRQHGVKRKREGAEDSSEHSSEPSTVKELNSSLLRLLECPVCLEWMEPPMSQCRRGHLVCGRCRARLASCPVCRTAFSSLRNRAMEGVAEMLRYPCRHGCGREVRLRRRTPHEASCPTRRYPCPAPPCAARAPLPLADLHKHTQLKHPAMVRVGRKHKISVKLNMEQHDNWFVLALQELFHLRLEVLRSFGVVVYVAYIGPKRNAHNFIYEVTVTGQHNSRKLIYARATHSDLESSSLNFRSQDCFYLTLDQALNFLRVKNRHSETDNTLDFNIEITKSEPTSANVREDSDS